MNTMDFLIDLNRDIWQKDSITRCHILGRSTNCVCKIRGSITLLGEVESANTHVQGPGQSLSSPYISGAQTVVRGPHVARKALWSGPRSNLHWKENLTLWAFKRIFIEIINSCGPRRVPERQMWPTSQKVWAPLPYTLTSRGLKL